VCVLCVCVVCGVCVVCVWCVCVGAHHEALRFPYSMCQLWSPTLGPQTDSDADCCHAAPSFSGIALLAGGCEKEWLSSGEWPVKGNWVTEASGPNQKALLSNCVH